MWLWRAFSFKSLESFLFWIPEPSEIMNLCIVQQNAQGGSKLISKTKFWFVRIQIMKPISNTALQMRKEVIQERAGKYSSSSIKDTPTICKKWLKSMFLGYGDYKHWSIQILIKFRSINTGSELGCKPSQNLHPNQNCVTNR